MITYKNINDESYTGRFANQVLAIAATISIAIKNNTAFGFESWDYQRFFKGSLPEVSFGVGHGSTKLLQIKKFGYSDIELENKYNYLIDNHFFLDNKEYWTALHSYKFFESCLNTLRYYFQPNFFIGDCFSNLVSIHVRKGDYVGHPLYYDLGKEYYQAAMDLFPKSRFIVFSDDNQWCKNSGWFPKNTLFGLEKYNAAPAQVMDWCYMQTCKAHIIANSSFSLSVAYLSEKETVAPSNWFSGYLKEFNKLSDLYRPEWKIV